LQPIAKSEISSGLWSGTTAAHERQLCAARLAAKRGARLEAVPAHTAFGVSVLNFPEGTTSRGGLLPFQLGAFWLARKSGLPIVPIGMEFQTPDMCWVMRRVTAPYRSDRLGQAAGQAPRSAGVRR
jgi:hypothetical protein